jgi:hypothetical protein
MHVPTAFSIPSLVIVGLIAPCPAHAQNPVGRYEMVTLPTKPGSYDSRVMILDTADGHLWQWWEAPAVGSSVPSSGITYLGKVAQGSAVGETTPAHRTGGSEQIVPRH